MYSTVSENVSSFKSMINKEDIIANLREVYDPEISINVFDLGLIYGIDIDEDLAAKFPFIEREFGGAWDTVRRADGSVVKP